MRSRSYIEELLYEIEVQKRNENNTRHNKKWYHCLCCC